MLVSNVLISLLLFSTVFAFGENQLEYSRIENPSEYILEIDDHAFFIPYEVNANVIAMDIDPELSSLLIGLDDARDSVFKIDLKHTLIDDTNNEFTILVNGIEVEYDIITDQDSSTFTFFIPEFTEEIEIIGTYVIPEFPLGPIIGFVILVSMVMIISKTKFQFFKL